MREAQRLKLSLQPKQELQPPLAFNQPPLCLLSDKAPQLPSAPVRMRELPCLKQLLQPKQEPPLPLLRLNRPPLCLL